MSLHIGDISSEVTVEGPPPAAGAAAGAGRDVQLPWDLRERHHQLTVEDHELQRRTAGEGFDG